MGVGKFQSFKVTFKLRSLQVIAMHAIQQVKYDFYWSSLVTMSLSCSVSEFRDIISYFTKFKEVT